MRKTVRSLLIAGTLPVMMWLTGCGHYRCGATFGASSCTQSGSGFSSNGNTATGAYVFAVNKSGTIDGFTLDTKANTLAATASYTGPAVPKNDEGSGMAIAQKKYLYAGFPTTDQIFGFAIGASGGLTAMTGSPYTAPYLAGTITGTSAMITNPAGTLLFVASLTSNQVFAYQIGTGGTLAAATGSPFTMPFVPANLATDGLGKYLYVTERSSSHSSAAVAAFSIGSSGTLTAVVGSPFSYPMWQVQGDPSGKYLIGTTGKSLAFTGTDDFHLYVFSIQQSGGNAGAITPVSGSPFATTYSPWGITMQPNTNGTYVYSFSINDTDTAYNSVEGFQLDASSGSLTVLQSSPFTSVSNGFWGQTDQSGQFLFVYGGFTTNGTVTTTLGALDVGSGGALTQPIPVADLATSGFWAVTDPQ